MYGVLLPTELWTKDTIISIAVGLICSFKKMFDVSCTDTAVECMKMFNCSEVSDVIVIGLKKLKFLQRYVRSDSIVCLACRWWCRPNKVTSIWLWTCPCLATYVVRWLFHFITCSVSLSSVFVHFFLYYFAGEIKMYAYYTHLYSPTTAVHK